MLDSMDEQMKNNKKHIQEAQKRQKKYYDKNKRALQFEKDDMVFLKVNPKQSNLILGKDKRLTPHFARL